MMLREFSWAYFLLGQVPLVSSSPSGLQEVFEVYQSVPFAPESNNDCDVEVVLMDHVFGASYGKPFVGQSSCY
jgi:hypothetical protein